MNDDQARRAEAFRALHRMGDPLVLPNAWDAATARVFERAGFPAIGTTSAGVAFARGYPDGERIPREEMLEAIALVCRSVSIPVTADVEAGYGSSPEELARTARDVLEAGAVGVNIEDAHRGPGAPLMDLSAQAAKIRAVRDAARERGVHLVINARTDVYLDRVGPESERFAETVRRGAAYREAGADCVFVPGVSDPAILGALVRSLACPINVLAVAATPPVGELARLGVARISLGSGPIRATMSLLQRMSAELRTAGTFSAFEGVVSHAGMNELMS